MSLTRRQAFHVAVFIYMATDAIYRMWRIAEGARAIDWAILIVDFLVLAVIVWLDAPERFHKRKVRKRLVVIQRMMTEGNALRNSVKSANENEGTADKWIRAAQTWMDTSLGTLFDMSTQAGLGFLHRAVIPDIYFGGVTNRPDVSKQFQELLIRLDNLQNIMEKADVYF